MVSSDFVREDTMKGRKGKLWNQITTVLLAAALIVVSGVGASIPVWAQESDVITENRADGETEGTGTETLSENSTEQPAEEPSAEETAAEEQQEPAKAEVMKEETYHWATWRIFVKGNYRYYPFEEYPGEVKAVDRENGETKVSDPENVYQGSDATFIYEWRLKNGVYDIFVDGEDIAEISLDDESPEDVEIVPAWTYYGVWFCDENDERPLEICYVKSGQTASAKEPGRPGYKFDGWVKTPGGNDKFDLSMPITETVKLYASWKEDSDASVTGGGWTLAKDGTLTVSSDQGIEDWATNGRSKYKQRVVSAKIDDSVTKLPDSAFEDCIRLAEVEMSENAAVWGDNAFNCCESLKSVEIPSGVTRIGEGVFFLCKAMTNITIPESVEQIGEYSFASSGLTAVRIPSRITKIPNMAFADCIALRSVDMTGEVTEIGEYAFGWSGLRSVRLSVSVKTIGKEAFYGCQELTEVNLSESLTQIGESAFRESGLKSIVIPDGVTMIGSWAFYQCSNLAKVKLPENLVQIGFGAFVECGLKTITIPRNVQNMAVWTFDKCAALEQVIMKPKEPPFMIGVFAGCDKMKKGSIIVPKGTAETYKAAVGWSDYKELIVEESTPDGNEGGGSGDQGSSGDQGGGSGQDDSNGRDGSSGQSGQGGNGGQSGQSGNSGQSSSGVQDSGGQDGSGGSGPAAFGGMSGRTGSGADTVETENDGNSVDAQNSEDDADREKTVGTGGIAEGKGTVDDGSAATALQGGVLDGFIDGDVKEGEGVVLIWCGVAALLFLLLILLLYLADRRYGIVGKMKKNGSKEQK